MKTPHVKNDTLFIDVYGTNTGDGDIGVSDAFKMDDRKCRMLPRRTRVLLVLVVSRNLDPSIIQSLYVILLNSTSAATADCDKHNKDAKMMLIKCS